MNFKTDNFKIHKIQLTFIAAKIQQLILLILCLILQILQLYEWQSSSHTT